MKFSTVFTVLFFVSLLKAQTTKKDVLFTVDDEPVYVSEFLRVYNKNLNLVQDESQKDVDEYLKLFTNYKLKLKEAKAQGLHEKPKYIKELEKYRKQLAKNYITDAEVSEALIKEAYDNISSEVNATHILVKIDESASPEDTLVAYNKIVDLRKRAEKEGFEKVRKEIHDGKTLYGEELGWFSGFRMVYKFEKVAFNTAVGEISQPFRTRFGYHIVNVLDKRKARGERTVKHIMIMHKNNDSIDRGESRINEIYTKLEQGESFEALAKQFSEDKNSASQGGLLKAFSAGQLRAPVFEETAFSLENKGDISNPIKSQYGWHIIKLENSKPIGSFQDLQAELETKVKRDARSQLIDDALYAKLKAKYNIPEKTPDLSYFTSILNEDFYKRNWEVPADLKGETALVTIGKKTLNYSDFADYLLSYQKRIRGRQDFKSIVEKAYELFLNTNLRDYEEENLENDNEDFAHILAEYRDGLLLFDLMESTIWQAAKTDSVEVEAFYQKNRENYFEPEHAFTQVASSPNKRVIKKVLKLLKENMPLENIKKLVNTNGEVNIIFTQDTMNVNHQALPKNFDLKEGLSDVYKHNDSFIVAKVGEVFPKKLKPFDEVKGLVMSDYQNNKENLWIEELKQKYKVDVNTEALKKVKAEIKQ
ncbi:MAG: peptidylprolyl isomerase [Jejuia sp.]